MSREMAAALKEQFQIPPEEAALLEKNIRQLSRQERRTFFQKLKPREREFKLFFKGEYGQLDEKGRQEWLSTTVQSLLDRGGEPDLVDSMVMDVIGRLLVYRCLRERAENEGIRLKALTHFGGLSMVLFLVVIITAIVLYLKGH
ncbi:MAG: hypothetical protein IMW93_11095 [Thermoanaerobacteraceae bacterium]|nr:hypothetical protein [Thermoanaerobacteraceae bacterium]